MIEPESEDLLNREIDGENTPEESAALRELIARHPEVRARYDDLLELALTLQRVGQVEPPQGLIDDAFRTIRQRQMSSARPHAWIRAVQVAFGRQPALRYGMAFASGLALGVFVLAFAGQAPKFSGAETPALSGTILSGAQSGLLHTVDEYRFTADGVRGVATTRLGTDVVVAEIQIDSRRDLDLALGFDSKVFSVLGFEGGTSGSNVRIGPGELGLRHAGEGRYVLVLGMSRQVPSPLRLKLTGDDGVSVEKTLVTGRRAS